MLSLSLIALSGCTGFDIALRPSVKTVVKSISAFRLGMPRQKILININNEYNRPFDIQSGIIPRGNIEWFKSMGSDSHYVVMRFPENILDLISDKTYNDALAFVWQTAEGSGNVYMFWDKNQRYMGFFAYYEK